MYICGGSILLACVDQLCRMNKDEIRRAIAEGVDQAPLHHEAAGSCVRRSREVRVWPAAHPDLGDLFVRLRPPEKASGL